ncbi:MULTISPECIES: Crp/Fnr family transcriptional regulator [Sphingobium]|uniref:CRP/FNR family transcriptional regulator n=1 Tax=Sphingobium lignivorans TaxID=2735886 RepID=A0ABR6NA17_9SPHN|nr:MULTISPECIES: Crp/Fnr family transcriptional regulator [Sphingobium]MBB5984115.1 CRP/FNR family transcriptional regulator [Sphingobium lignivorans]BAK64802.1 Crp family transcriptional regulator [Sphingobium sp. SYK-6]
MARMDVLPVARAYSDIAGLVAAPPRCRNCAVRDSALCSSLDNRELSALSDIGRRRTIPAGQVVSWAGDASSSCANVVNGTLKVTATMADGREQIVGLLFPGDFVGQLFSDETSLTVTALTDTDICSYSRTAFEGLLDDLPRMERMLLKRTMASLNEARDRMLSLGRKNAQERVAGFILDLADRSGREEHDGSIHVHLPISRGGMADYLGLTIETVSRQLTNLKSAGIISFAKGDRECRILDRDQLEDIVNPA